MPLKTALLLLLCLPAGAEFPPGYVVKIESNSIYLDFTEKMGAAVGQPFSVYSEGEELKHPVTGQSLGKVEKTLAEGKITQVAALYSVGDLTTLKADAAEIKPGTKARLGAIPVPPTPAPVQPVAAPAATNFGGRAPRWQSKTFPYQTLGMAVAEFEPGKLATAMSDGKKVFLYAYPPADNKPLAEYELPGSGVRVLSLDAGDANGNKKAELFVTAYNQTFNRVETTVLELDGGKWVQVAQTPWIVRQIQDASGKPLLAAEQLVEDNTFPFSSIYPLSVQDGKYGAGKGSIKPKRVDWIYGFTNATLDGAPTTLYLTSTGHLRVQFEKGSWKTGDSYCQTPVRLRWPNHEGRLLEFSPAVRVGYDAEGKAAVYAPRNLSMLGSLSEPFGLFNGGELQRLSWNGVALAVDWKADLGGYTPSIALVDNGGKKDVAVAIVGTSGRSTVWIFDP